MIKHFSDTVQYQANGFLEKNRDTISKELVNVMRESKLTICRTLMSMNQDPVPRDKASTLDGRVKINAAKHLVSKLIKQYVPPQKWWKLWTYLLFRFISLFYVPYIFNPSCFFKSHFQRFNHKSFFLLLFFRFQNTNTVPKKVSSSFMCHFDYLQFALSYRILDLSNGFWLSNSFIFDITELTNTIQINFTSLISFYFFEIFYCLLNFIIFIS